MPQIKKEHIKQTIIDNSVLLFEKNGYDNTTIKQIAEQSGISVGNIYKYFKDKYEIFRGIVTREFLDELKDVLYKRANLNVKRLYKPLLIEENEWFEKVYYPFFINNAELCILLANYSQGNDYTAIINSMAHRIMEIKVEEYSKYTKSSICDEFVKLSTIIIMSNVELYVRILTSKENKNTKIKLLKLADEYHISGMNKLCEQLIIKENK